MSYLNGDEAGEPYKGTGVVKEKLVTHTKLPGNVVFCLILLFSKFITILESVASWQESYLVPSPRALGYAAVSQEPGKEGWLEGIFAANTNTCMSMVCHMSLQFYVFF